MAELHLVGTLAQDPDGAARLAAVLEAVQPDVVAVEASRAGFEHQRSHGDAASAAALAAITARGVGAATSAFWRRWLAKEHLHFEVFTAAAFAAARGLPLHFLDAGGDSGDSGDSGSGTTASPPDDAEDSAADADGAAAYRLADAQTLTALAAHDWAAAYAADLCAGAGGSGGQGLPGVSVAGGATAGVLPARPPHGPPDRGPADRWPERCCP